jgi:hypothetical protein
MTWTITAGVAASTRANSFAALSSTVGAILIGLLVVLLLLRELRRIRARPGDREAGEVIDVLLAPLLLAYPLIVVVRLLLLLQ